MPPALDALPTQQIPVLRRLVASGVEATVRIAARPVFVDDGGRRKRLLMGTGYLAAAACVGYLVVVGISLTAGLDGPLDGSALLVPAGPAPAPTAPTPAVAPPAATMAVPAPLRPATRAATRAAVPAPSAVATPASTAPAPVTPTAAPTSAATPAPTYSRSTGNPTRNRQGRSGTSGTAGSGTTGSGTTPSGSTQGGTSGGPAATPPGTS